MSNNQQSETQNCEIQSSDRGDRNSWESIRESEKNIYFFRAEDKMRWRKRETRIGIAFVSAIKTENIEKEDSLKRVDV